MNKRVVGKIALMLAVMMMLFSLQVLTAFASDELVASINKVYVNGVSKGAIYTTGDYNRFDIYFNMAIADEAGEETGIETMMQAEFGDSIIIDGKYASDYNDDAEGTMKMEYDHDNEILRVYMKTASFSASKDHEVVIPKYFTTINYEAEIEGRTVFNYDAAANKWTKTSVNPDTVFVTSVTVTGNTTMAMGTTQTLKAEVKPIDAETSVVEWSSSNKAVATVTDKGVVTTYKAGTVTITATALDDAEESDSIKITVTEQQGPEGPDIVKTASQSYTSIKVSWSKITGATGYKVYCSPSLNGSYSCVYTTNNPDKLSVVHYNRVTGKPYYYRVRGFKVVDGVNKYITFSSAKVGKAVPAKPKNFKASCYNATTEKLSWSEVAGAYGYKVYQSTSGKAGTFYKLYETDDPNKTNVTVYNRTTGKTYYYKVRAISEYSGSEVSGTLTSAVSVKVLPTKPTITLTKPASRSVKISWNAIYKASGYEVYRSLSGRDGTFYLNKRITSGTTTSHTNTGMTKGETYYYKVRTYRTVDGKRIYSAFSAVKKITL